jgi:Protein of unknown function (DUF2971)
MREFNHIYLDIKEQEKKLKLFRIISLDRLFEIFSEKNNTLVKPHLWDDPFENFIMGLKGLLPDGKLVEFGQRYAFYGQCWSTIIGSDAMWRIYSSDKRSVSIQVRINKLAEQFAYYAKSPVYIGKVRYLTTEGLLSWSKRLMNTAVSPSIKLLAKTLLVKRSAFSHENEVRLLYFDHHYDNFNYILDGKNKYPNTIFKYGIEPHELIESIILDPRMSPEEAKDTTEMIKVKTRYRGEIRQSQLYATPPDFVLKLNKKYATMEQAARKLIFEGDRKILKAPRDSPYSQMILPVDDKYKF